MKKLLVLLSVGVLALGIVGCNKPGNGESDSSGSVNSDQQSDVQQSSDQPDSGEQSSEPVESSDQVPPTEEGDQQQTGTVVNGHDYLEGWTEEMEAVKTAVTDAVGENYWPDFAMTPDVLEMSFGITPDMYDDYLAESPMISTNVDTLVIIKAKEDRVEDVEEALNAYRDAKVNDTMQYPMNIGKIQASRIEKIGNYICFVQLGADTMDLEEEAAIEHCQQANELVIEVLQQQLQQ